MCCRFKRLNFEKILRVQCMILVNITQMDLAMINVITSEAVSILTIRLLLNEKTFGKKTPLSECEE